jgi:alcohol dehydrogenase
MTAGESPTLRSVAPLLRRSPVRVVFGGGRIEGLGALCTAEGARRILLVTDAGLVSAGHVDRARVSLERAGLWHAVFDGAAQNPTTDDVMRGVESARGSDIDFIVALGGGSAMDCAKGVNLILTHGGRIEDYWGEGKTSAPLLAMAAVPTTAGTGSEAQSFALITDPATRVKMACGDRRPPREGGLRPRFAILDPELLASVPPRVASAAGIDAVAHAVESVASTRRNAASRGLSQAAWRVLDGAFDRAMGDRAEASARGEMLLGAHLGGAAIEQSMLGAAHACANPLTARFGVVHGFAVGVMLPHVVRFNSETSENPYRDLHEDAAALARRIEAMLDRGRVPRRLVDHGVAESDLPALAEEASRQWTARFNPRPVGPDQMLALYERAMR